MKINELRGITTLSILAIIFTTGCGTVVRENILSSIDTGLGATLAENKETQLYELKAGYIHSQFYSIPTGKMVENKKGDSSNTTMVTSPTGATQGAKFSNAANITPQVVSGIKANISLADVLIGMNVSENFAVGDIAVNSFAASAMYISTANNTNSATAASQAIEAISQSTNSPANVANITMQQQKVAISNAYQAATAGAAAAPPNPPTQGNILLVIQAVSGDQFTDLLNFMINASPDQTSSVYNILKNQKIIH